jgi:hypothetical protein
MVWLPLMRREVLSKNRYGSAATRRTLRIGQGAVNRRLSRSFIPARPRPVPASVQVGEAAAGVRLGVLHAA